MSDDRERPEGESASKSSSPTPNDDREYSLQNFVEDNYHLITISGLFAAIAVYLTRLSQQLPVEAQYGIAGSLLVFLLLMLIVIENGFETATKALSDGNHSEFGAITVVNIGISALVYSTITISAQYADEMTPILDIAGALVSVSIYTAFLWTDFLQDDPENAVQYPQRLVQISPFIAFGILYHFFPVQSRLDSMTIGELSFSIIPGMILHLLLTFAVLQIIETLAMAFDLEELMQDQAQSE